MTTLIYKSTIVNQKTEINVKIIELPFDFTQILFILFFINKKGE